MSPCKLCYLTMWSSDEECPFCDYSPPSVVRGLWVPQDRSQPVTFIEFPVEWRYRLGLIAMSLSYGKLARTELGADGEQAMGAHHSADDEEEPNPRLWHEDVCGDAVVLIMSLESGEEVSMPNEVKLHLIR